MPEIDLDLSETEADEGGGGMRSLPTGWHRLMVAKADVRRKEDEGKVGINVDFQALDDRRHVFHYYNVTHPSQKAQEIGRAQFKALAIAVGHPTPDLIKRTEDLHGIPFWGYVKREKADNERFGDDEGFQSRLCRCQHIDDVPDQIAGSGGVTKTQARNYDQTEAPPLAPADDDIPF